MAYKIYQVKDETDKFVIDKDLWNIPFRIAIVGKSGTGKTSLLVNLVGHPDYYGNDFQGDNIYIVSGSLENDEKIQKLIKLKEIPSGNVMGKYNEEELQNLYNEMKQKFREDREKDEVKHKLIIFDDISFSGHLKDKLFGVISEMACNCRKLCVSLIFTAQKYSQLSTTVRTNLNGAIFFRTTTKELDLIEQDFNYNPSAKKFNEAFAQATKEKLDFFVVNREKKRDQMYCQNFNTFIEL
jgi:ABC-type dipeptide/oligopeptide/nickel transport system ATPase component